MADWNNETDSIVIGKCVNANSEHSSGVNGTKQGNNGKATSTTTTTFRIGLGGRWK